MEGQGQRILIVYAKSIFLFSLTKTGPPAHSLGLSP